MTPAGPAPARASGDAAMGSDTCRNSVREPTEAQDISMNDTHFEEFLWLVDVTDDAVLIAWGGFWFRRSGAGARWRLLPAAELGSVDPGRTLTVGARSQPYGDASATVRDDDGQVVGVTRTSEMNHAWITGLRPDTRYHYRVVVDGVEWAAGERWDWGPAGDGGMNLGPRGRSYTTTFRTAPRRRVDGPLDFAVLGDFGVGACDDSAAGARQLRVAGILDRLVADDEVRLVLTTGDNVYDGGDVDVDWYAGYFHPYRYSLARVPVYPTVGNHDSAETERSDDRDILYGNFHIDERFTAGGTRRASTEHGLYYRFGYGADVEFVCVDTSEGLAGPFPHSYQHPETQRFLREALDVGAARPRWRIVFCHHPPYCAGPEHDSSEAMREWVVPLLRDGGANVVLSGHEHNFQYTSADGVSYFVTGAAGKLQPEPPTRFDEADTRAWAAAEHLLHVRVEPERITVTPLGGLDPDGTPSVLLTRDRDGGLVEAPFVVPAIG